MAFVYYFAIFGMPIVSYALMYNLIDTHKKKGIISFCFALIMWNIAMLLVLLSE